VSNLIARAERFAGREGRVRLAETLNKQELISHELTTARKFALAAKVKTLEAGQDLYLQGEAGRNSVFFLVGGKLGLLVNEKRVRMVNTGEMIGEFPILDSGLAYAVTVRSAEDAVLAVVPEGAFRAIATEHPIIWEKMAEMLVRRLCETTRAIPPRKSPVRVHRTRQQPSVERSQEVHRGSTAHQDCHVRVPARP